MVLNKGATPSFKGLIAASPLASRVKSRNTAVDTKPEILLRQKLWRRGLRYRKDVRKLPGRPDIVFATAKLIVFCDGDFWHGKNWPKLKRKLGRGSNADYWVSKIAMNRKRDIANTRLLETMDWMVIRVWESDVLQRGDTLADEIFKAFQGRRQKNFSL